MTKIIKCLAQVGIPDFNSGGKNFNNFKFLNITFLKHANI